MRMLIGGEVVDGKYTPIIKFDFGEKHIVFTCREVRFDTEKERHDFADALQNVLSKVPNRSAYDRNGNLS